MFIEHIHASSLHRDAVHYVLNMPLSLSPQSRILHRLAGVAGLKLKEVSAMLGIPHNTYLQIIQGRRKLQPELWQRAALLMGLASPNENANGTEAASYIFKDLLGRHYSVGFLQWWQEKALPYLTRQMNKRHEQVPAWSNNEAELLKALFRAAAKKNRLPIAANVIRRALMDAARTLNLEQEWEQEARAASVKDIRYCLSPVDLDKAPLPSVSITAREWTLSASPVPISADSRGDD